LAGAKDDWKLSRAALDQAELARSARLDQARAQLAQAYALLDRAQTSDAMVVPQAVDEASKELTLWLMPGAGEWFAFTSRGAEVRTHRLEGVPPPELVQQAGGATLDRENWSSALAPVLAGIVSANELRVVAHPALRDLDVHALKFQGEPVMSRLPVVYAVDSGRPPGTTSSGGVLIVGDPRNDLPQARKEAEEVALRWKQHSPAVLFGADALEATVRERLQQAEFFHYSGHGVFSGVDGVDSTLALAEGGALDLGEILTLSHVPSKVVLSACDSAGSETASDQGLTLAEAFVSAGADLVVAPTRRIKDTTARKFMARLYELLPSASSQAWAAAVQRAGLNLRESGEADVWVSFRLVRP
jgi:hypothetical protein